MSERFAIERVAIRNFRSILHSQVDILEPLTYVVGPNGSGKTNFVNGLLFIRNGLNGSLEKAVNAAGGVMNIIPAPPRMPSTMELRVEWKTSWQSRGFYSIELQFESNRTYSVAYEECETTNPDGRTSRFEVRFGEASGTPEILPAGARDRLYLVQASGLPEFRTVYDCLAGIQASEFVPVVLFTFPSSSRTDYEGFANRVIRLRDGYPDRMQIVEEYMRAILPSFRGFEIGVLEGNVPFLKFMETTHIELPVGFSVNNMSSGSVYLADLLIDLFSPPDSGKPYVPWIIEEPETGLHPGAIRVVRDALFEASHFRQLIVTTHNPEFLDDDRLSDRNIVATHRDSAGSHISNLDAGTAHILRDSLYTAGELLRQGLLDLSEVRTATDGD